MRAAIASGLPGGGSVFEQLGGSAVQSSGTGGTTESVLVRR